MFFIHCENSQLTSHINSCRKGDALDVNNEAEYRDMVKKIQDNCWSKINIVIDLDDVKKACPVTINVSRFHWQLQMSELLITYYV